MLRCYIAYTVKFFRDGKEKIRSFDIGKLLQPEKTVYIYIYTHTHTHTRTHTHTHAHTHTHIYVCVCVCVRPHACVYVCVYWAEAVITTKIYLKRK